MLLPRVQFRFFCQFLTVLCWFILKIIWYFRQEGKRLDSNFLITILVLKVWMFMMGVLVVLVTMNSKCHDVTPHMGQQVSNSLLTQHNTTQQSSLSSLKSAWTLYLSLCRMTLLLRNTGCRNLLLLLLSSSS